MSLNSVNTNIGAMVALQSLNKTNTDLATTQKRISTGFRVSDARDDGAAFAVAERVRGEVAATTSANEQLGGVKGLLNVTQTALQNISTTLISLKDVIVKLADGSTSEETRTQYGKQAYEMGLNIKAFIEDATYNNKNILDGTVTNRQLLVRNAVGDIYSFSGFDANASIYDSIAAYSDLDVTAAAAALTTAGSIQGAITRTLTYLNNFGNYQRYIDIQITYNKAKIDAQESGLASLIDADLAKESARLQALQIRQQLGTQSLSIANQSPQSLLSLFR